MMQSIFRERMINVFGIYQQQKAKQKRVSLDTSVKHIHRPTHALSLCLLGEKHSNWTLKVRLQEYQERAVGVAVTIPEEITMATKANKMLY